MPGGEVLIIAGDACEVKKLIAESKKGVIDTSTPCYEFFMVQCQKYEKVFYVLGNHEYYGHRTWKLMNELQSVLPDNVTVLDDQAELYNGVLFIGATLWTDLQKANPIVMETVRYGMNDYRKITHQTVYAYRKLQPKDTVIMHKKSISFIKETLDNNTETPSVVITHHAPSHNSISEYYRGSLLSDAYASSLEELILDHENIKHWVHGHVHHRNLYKVGNTVIHSNPRGYLPYESNTGFDVNYTFEL